MKKRLIICFIVFTSLGCYSTLSSQTVEDTYSMGVEAYEIGNRELAKRYFERVAFFDSDSLRFLAHNYLGNIYFDEALYADAIKSYRYAENYDLRLKEDEEHISVKKVKSWIALKKYRLAYAETFNIPKTKEYQNERLLYQAYTLYEIGDYRESKAAYLNLVPDNQKIVLIHLFNTAVEIENRNLKIYEISSYIIPGLGQAMAGQYIDAVNSFVIVTVLAAAFIYTAATIGIIEGMIAAIPWLYRYYKGGAENAGKWAVQHKEKRLHSIHLEILNLLE